MAIFARSWRWKTSSADENAGRCRVKLKHHVVELLDSSKGEVGQHLGHLDIRTFEDRY